MIPYASLVRLFLSCDCTVLSDNFYITHDTMSCIDKAYLDSPVIVKFPTNPQIMPDVIDFNSFEPKQPYVPDSQISTKLLKAHNIEIYDPTT